MIRSLVFALASLVALSACDAPPPPDYGVKSSALTPAITSEGFSVAPPNAPRGPVVDAFARTFLDSIQPRSIRERREYCGYFFVDMSGQLQATTPRAGTFASCSMPAPHVGQGIIASYHTHSAYGAGYDNEVPSVVDLMSDFEFGIDGYVSTPGGRVWFVDFQTRSTRQICRAGCVFSDPGYVPDRRDTILAAYDLNGLRRREASY